MVWTVQAVVGHNGGWASINRFLVQQRHGLHWPCTDPLKANVFLHLLDICQPLLFLLLSTLDRILTHATMQSSTARTDFNSFPKPLSGEGYPRALGLPFPIPAKPLLDFRNFSEPGKHPAVREDLRLHHQSMQMHPGSSYGFNQDSAYSNHHTQPLYPTVTFPTNTSAQRNTPIYAPGYVSRQNSHSTLADDSYSQTQQKSGSANKQFPCGTCTKRFARRSDLARHGRLLFPPAL
jgi:hypothetical protein